MSDRDMAPENIHNHSRAQHAADVAAFRTQQPARQIRLVSSYGQQNIFFSNNISTYPT
jgi:hypothetical protein